LEIIDEDNLIQHAELTGNYLQEQLLVLADQYPLLSNVRGKGLLTAFDFPDKETRDSFLKQGLAKNTLFLGCGERSIRFRPALIIQNEDIDKGITVIQEVLRTL